MSRCERGQVTFFSLPILVSLGQFACSNKINQRAALTQIFFTSCSSHTFSENGINLFIFFNPFNFISQKITGQSVAYCMPLPPPKKNIYCVSLSVGGRIFFYHQLPPDPPPPELCPPPKLCPPLLLGKLECVTGKQVRT